jgi:hypothetical protein
MALQDLQSRYKERERKLRETEQERDKIQSEYDSVRGSKHWGEFQAREIGVSVDTAALKAENEQLKRQNEELTQRLDERKRERIDKWRSVIRDFDFETERFAETDTYSQMKQCGLKPEVIDMIEAQRIVHVGNEARGDTAYKSTLLDEVARIENERVLNAPEVANDKESLRHRCILLGQELLQFMKVHGYSDETVNRFVQRHEWKVNELRDELDERAWLTTQERDTLTFHADDYSHKIEEIANTLVLLGRGH